MRILLGVLAVSVLCSGFSCGDDPFDSVLEPAPLKVTSLVPADSAQVNWADPINISITFNRVVDLGEIRISLVPPAASSGELRKTGSGRNVTWFDVLTNPDDTVQRMLLDGRYMEFPAYVEWYTGDPLPRSLFAGTILSERPESVLPKGAVVFALDGEAPFNPLDPSSFTGIPPVALTVVEFLDSGDGGIYVVGRLEEFRELLVVCVIDTNDDARYDPTEDWWGYFGEGPENTPEVVVAAQHPSQVNSQVNITLRPPR